MRRALETAVLILVALMCTDQILRDWLPKPIVIEVPIIREPEPQVDYWPEKPAAMGARW